MITPYSVPRLAISNKILNMDKDEIISKLGWFTQMKSIPPLTDKFKTEQIIFFENIIHFLQDNGLTTKEILKKGEKPTDNTEIKIGDLTEEGLKFYLYGIRKWRQKYDRAKDGIKAINDFAFIEKKLKEFRSKNIANEA